MTSDGDRDLPDWLHLTEAEEVLRVAHPRLPPFALRMAAGVAASLVGIVALRRLDLPDPLAWATIVLVGVGLCATGWWYLKRWTIWYVITSGGLYKKTGVLSREVVQVRHERVQTADFSQTLLERLLSYGDVRIYTAGSGTIDLVFEAVGRPETVANLVSRQQDAVEAARREGAPRTGRRPGADPAPVADGTND